MCSPLITCNGLRPHYGSSQSEDQRVSPPNMPLICVHGSEKPDSQLGCNVPSILIVKDFPQELGAATVEKHKVHLKAPTQSITATEVLMTTLAPGPTRMSAPRLGTVVIAAIRSETLRSALARGVRLGA